MILGDCTRKLTKTMTTVNSQKKKRRETTAFSHVTKLAGIPRFSLQVFHELFVMSNIIDEITGNFVSFHNEHICLYKSCTYDF